MTLRTRGEPSGPHGQAGAASPPSAEVALPTAGWGRRVIALLLDWWTALAIAAGFFHGSAIAQLVIFVVMQLVLVGTTGSSIGHRLMGLQVRRADGGWADPAKVVMRTLLVCLVIPPVVTQSDGRRGLHDVVAGTVITPR